MLEQEKDAHALWQLALAVRGTSEEQGVILSFAELKGAAPAGYLRRIRREDGWSAAARRAAMRASGVNGPADIDREILDLVGDASAPFADRRAALLAVTRARDARAFADVARLCEEVDETSVSPAGPEGTPEVNGSYLLITAMGALVPTGGVRALPVLRRLVRASNDYFGHRGHAADALAELGDPAAIRDLEEALADPATTRFGRSHVEAALQRLRGRGPR